MDDPPGRSDAPSNDPARDGPVEPGSDLRTEAGAPIVPDPGPEPAAAASGLAPEPLPGLEGARPDPGQTDPRETGPLTREAARALLDRGAALLQAGEPEQAAASYQRLVGHREAAVTSAALLGLGQALRRMDHEDAALEAWQSVLRLPVTPATYPALREIAAALVRNNDLTGALDAYRRADRLAPPEDRPEIASRLGWLSKETGDPRAAQRHFARARRAGPALPMTWILVGITVVVSVAAWTNENDPTNSLYPLLWLDKAAVAAGEYYRLFTSALIHAPIDSPLGPFHLIFNMYALYLVGPLVELLYGSGLFLGFYVLLAAAGSVASFVFGANEPSVGASGAIFGLFGVLLAASRAHNPVLDRRRRSLVAQVGPIILLNLLFGLLNAGEIDNSAHVGGLLAGLWLGYLLVPGRVPTMSRLWRRPETGPDADNSALNALRVLGVAALVLVLAVGLVVGTQQRRSSGNDGAPSVVASLPIAHGSPRVPT